MQKDTAITPEAQPAGSVKPPKAKPIRDGARNNADSLGVGLPLVLHWAVVTFTDVEIPIDVAIVLAGMLASIGAKVKQRF